MEGDKSIKVEGVFFAVAITIIACLFFLVYDLQCYLFWGL